MSRSAKRCWILSCVSWAHVDNLLGHLGVQKPEDLQELYVQVSKWNSASKMVTSETAPPTCQELARSAPQNAAETVLREDLEDLHGDDDRLHAPGRPSPPPPDATTPSPPPSTAQTRRRNRSNFDTLKISAKWRASQNIFAPKSPTVPAAAQAVIL